ncbi:3-hydroxyacyl-CoA dehydrogenase family protein [Kutzneria kofuensis]|uniref:3-hydroxyacyl-CoA dehydrogenase family protein n=1 Tax=Kutzneria kofuensis TaxID=103725 RepID=UPI0033702890
MLSSVRWTAVEKDLDDVQFVVECGPERIPLKQELFRMLDAVCPPDAVLASCTSAIPIGLLAACTGRPELVLGMHFMNPAPLKPVVEVARTEQTGADTLRRADELLAGMGKRGIVVVRDAPGFVSNRVLMSTINDAATVVQEGTADPATVDKVFEDCFGHRMGPLRTRRPDRAGHHPRHPARAAGDHRRRPVHPLRAAGRHGPGGQARQEVRRRLLPVTRPARPRKRLAEGLNLSR